MGLSEEKPIHMPELFEPLCGLYPGIASFTAEYDTSDYREWVFRSNGDPVPGPLVLAVEDGVQTESSLCPAITREIQLQSILFDRDRRLEGVVCTSGITIGWSDDALSELSSSIQNAFSVEPTARSCWCACFGKIFPSAARLELLRKLGFNKARLGVDLSLSYQDRAGLFAYFERVENSLLEARRLEYRSLAIDLILPAALTRELVDKIETFLTQTCVETIRIMVASEAQGFQPNTVLSDFRATILPGLGYRHLGLDWYVTESEPSLGVQAPLYWSPLGYTNIEGLDIIGTGPGAVSVLEDACSQNSVQRERYQRLIEQGELPMQWGIELESDDVLRRAVMSGLIVNEYFDIGELEERWGILFPKYFETEMSALRDLEHRGKLLLSKRGIRMLERDRRALTELCRIFDNPRRVASVPQLQGVR
ncbi:hypothetical protein MNBD_GAMMA15-1999 [hydrothermal vent metagenome]|uniref:Coproporphyrinogen III oxidase, oxygen-independent n=1 Tax=hydrothermal vent metagenome TaxID=652676 RepID=A0A3B0Z1R8_9ZZZZ